MDYPPISNPSYDASSTDAKAELAVCGGDVGRSALHVVVIDKIDVVFWRRSGKVEDGGG